MTRRANHLHYIVLVFLIVIGYGLRFAYLDRDMRYDESLTVYQFASKNIPTIVGDYSMMNNHILHNLFVHFTFYNLGRDPIFVRLPVFIAGILLIPMAYVAGTRFYDRTVGLITASLVAVYPILIDFSVNARAYNILALIVLWMFVLAYELRKHNDTGKWLLLSVLAAAGFFAVPTMFYAMGIVALWLLFSIWFENSGEQRTELLKNYVVSMILGAILTLLAYTPVIVFNGIDKIINNDWTRPLPPAEFYPEFNLVLGRIWQHITWGVPDLMVFTLCVCLAVSVIFHRKFEKKLLPLLPFMIVWILPILLIQRVNPFRRTWLFAVPLLLMLTAAGISYLLDRFKLKQMNLIAAGSAILSLVMFAYILQSGILITSEHTVRAPDAEEGAILLADIMTTHDQVILSFPYSYTVLYYSLAYEFPLGYREFGNAESHDTETEDSGLQYVYIFYPKSDEPALAVQSPYTDEELDNAEIVAEWDFGILRRIPLNSD